MRKSMRSCPRSCGVVANLTVKRDGREAARPLPQRQVSQLPAGAMQAAVKIHLRSYVTRNTLLA